MVKKRFNFKYVALAVILCLTALVPIFAFKVDNKVYADEVVTSYIYTGSTLFIPYFSNYEGETEVDFENNEKGFMNFAVDFSPNAYNTAANIRFHIDKFYEHDEYNGAPFSAFVSRPNQYILNSASISANVNFFVTLSVLNVPEVVNVLPDIGRRVWIGDKPDVGANTIDHQYLNQMYISCSSHKFNGGVSQIRVGAYPVSDITTPLYTPNYSYFDYVNYVRYVDINGEWLMFCFPTRSSAPIYGASLPMIFSDRTYLTNLYLTDDNIYKQGFKDGVEQGIEDGYDSAYQDGRTDGLREGYQNGYNNYKDNPSYNNAIDGAYNDGYGNGYASGYAKGKADFQDGASESMRFQEVISTLLGSPLDVTSRMLNFNLLGINVWAFLAGLFTLLLIIKFIRIFM